MSSRITPFHWNREASEPDIGGQMTRRGGSHDTRPVNQGYIEIPWKRNLPQLARDQLKKNRMLQLAVGISSNAPKRAGGLTIRVKEVERKFGAQIVRSPKATRGAPGFESWGLLDYDTLSRTANNAAYILNNALAVTTMITSANERNANSTREAVSLGKGKIPVNVYTGTENKPIAGQRYLWGSVHEHNVQTHRYGERQVEEGLMSPWRQPSGTTRLAHPAELNWFGYAKGNFCLNPTPRPPLVRHRVRGFMRGACLVDVIPDICGIVSGKQAVDATNVRYAYGRTW
ncbi:hypothetical protein BDZ97DRAFT_1759825 [Flammula alnicola]|nr:hypothetical protein BDZ97DRAFT_1759825 [Flammula alnicola]